MSIILRSAVISPVRRISKFKNREACGHNKGIQSDVSIKFRHISWLPELDAWPERLEWVWSQAQVGRLKEGTRKGLLRWGEEYELCK